MGWQGQLRLVRAERVWDLVSESERHGLRLVSGSIHRCAAVVFFRAVDSNGGEWHMRVMRETGLVLDCQQVPSFRRAMRWRRLQELRASRGAA